MNQATGQILRGVGLAIETVCLLAYITFQYEGAFGWDVRPALMAGVALGVILWIAGLAIIHFSTRKRPL